MEYVVFETGGKQYKAHLGGILDLDRINGDRGTVIFDKVLLYVNDGEIAIGKPYVSGISVTAKIVKDYRGRKNRILRFTAKSRHRRAIGFRRQLTKVQVLKILKKSKSKG